MSSGNLPRTAKGDYHRGKREHRKRPDPPSVALYALLRTRVANLLADRGGRNLEIDATVIVGFLRGF